MLGVDGFRGHGRALRLVQVRPYATTFAVGAIRSPRLTDLDAHAVVADAGRLRERAFARARVARAVRRARRRGEREDGKRVFHRRE